MSKNDQSTPSHLRSLLFIPVVHAERYLASLAKQPPDRIPDALILDLEDSVPDQRKEQARRMLSGLLDPGRGGIPPGVDVLVRINAVASPHAEADLAVLATGQVRDIDGVMLPKCAGATDLDAVRGAMPAGFGGTLLPLIETLAGHASRDQICARAAELGARRIAFGAGDMSIELGIPRDYGSDLLRRLAIDLVIAARRRGLDVVDTPARVIPDRIGEPGTASDLEAECVWARRNGMKGKLAIHPDQVPFIARTFSEPSRLSWARGVVAEFAAHPEGRSLRHPDTGEYMGTPTLKEASAIIASDGGHGGDGDR